MARLVSRIRQAVERITREADEAVQETASDVRDLAKTLAPVRTGRLRKSIGKRKTRRGAAAVGTDVEYGVFQEFGTRKMSARPYLTPALEQGKEILRAKLKEKLKGG